jgi:hypothetical protein
MAPVTDEKHTTLTTMSTGGSDRKADVAHDEHALAHEEVKKLTLWQSLRRWPKVSAYCLALTSAILLWGYDLAVSDAASHQFGNSG